MPLDTTDDDDGASREGGGLGAASRRSVLIAIADPDLEGRVVAALSGPRSGLTVVRRCVDLADLLAAATSGAAEAVIVSAGMRRFDQEALRRLELAGLAVVGLNDDAAPDAERREARLRQLGVRHVVPVPSSRMAGADVLQALTGAVERAVRDEGHAVGGAAAGASAALVADVMDVEPQPPHGRIVAVWGPTGAPGRTFLAWHLAGELADAGHRVLVVDGDVYGGCLAQHAGLVDEAPGLVAASRAANVGALDVARLAGLCRRIPDGERDGGVLTVLTGIARASRWPEIRPAALTTVLELARALADVVLVDCGFSLEEDEELSYDTAAPRRNAATVATLTAADEVLVVGAADPVGLTRLISGIGELEETLGRVGADAVTRVVVNRLRGSSRERRQVVDALERHAGRTPEALVPLDLDAAERAFAAGLPLAHSAARSPARDVLGDLAARLVGTSGAPAPSRRGRRRLSRSFSRG
ncbi:MAG TPA: chromosome partitioning protein [Frankiaceae bacterium]|nr:chromosome partitioning protein [Frankiaceae bacterium]